MTELLIGALAFGVALVLFTALIIGLCRMAGRH